MFIFTLNVRMCLILVLGYLLDVYFTVELTYVRCFNFWLSSGRLFYFFTQREYAIFMLCQREDVYFNVEVCTLCSLRYFNVGLTFGRLFNL